MVVIQIALHLVLGKLKLTPLQTNDQQIPIHLSCNWSTNVIKGTLFPLSRWFLSGKSRSGLGRACWEVSSRNGCDGVELQRKVQPLHDGRLLLNSSGANEFPEQEQFKVQQAFFSPVGNCVSHHIACMNSIPCKTLIDYLDTETW